MFFRRLLAALSSWWWSSSTDENSCASQNNQSNDSMLDSPVPHQTTEFKSTPSVKECVNYFSTPLPSSGLIPTSSSKKEFTPPSSGVVRGNAPLNNTAYGIRPTPPRNLFVMRKQVAARNTNLHPYNRKQEKRKPEGSLLFRSLEELRSIITGNMVKYPKKMSPDSVNTTRYGYQTTNAERNYRPVLETQNHQKPEEMITILIHPEERGRLTKVVHEPDWP